VLPNKLEVDRMALTKNKVKAFWSLETKAAPKLLLAPIFIFLLTLTVFPLLFAITTSLQSYKLTDPLDQHFIGLYNFLAVLKDERFWNSLKNTLQFISFSLVMEMILGMIVALLLTRKFRGSQIAKSLFLLPTITTPVVVGLIWVMLYDSQFGIINFVLGKLGLPLQTWLSNTHAAMWALIAVDIWEWTPYVALVLLAGLQSLPHEPYEAAEVDGASAFQKFFHLTLPLIQPYILIAVVFRFMDSFRWFDTIYVMTRGGPGIATETVNMYGYLQGFTHLNMGYAATLGLCMLFIITFVSKRIVSFTRKG
jgi:multiple sugar transport system permease protein